MHIVAIILFPVRLVTAPIICPPVSYFWWALANNTSSNLPYAHFWPMFGQVVKGWVFWHA